jgi:hypothetical protein
MSNLETVTITVTNAQAQAMRKLALRSSKKSATALANDLFGQIVRGRFKAVTEGIVDDAATKYDMAVANGFTPPMERKDFVAKAKEEYADILSQL